MDNMSVEMDEFAIAQCAFRYSIYYIFYRHFVPLGQFQRNPLQSGKLKFGYTKKKAIRYLQNNGWL